MEETKKAYKSILRLLNKHKDIINIDIDRVEESSKLHLYGLELKNTYGLDINPTKINSTVWQKIDEYKCIGLYDGEKRKISWSDDGTQPRNEILLNISFPTGAYIFGGDYPTEYFQNFWLELLTYNPDYIDTHNHSIYFSMNNASKIFNEFNSILKKYHDENKEDIKKRKIRKIEEELKKLKN